MAGLFVLFAIILLLRFSGGDAPSFAFLGRLLSSEKSAVWFDIARNIALAVALLALGIRHAPSVSPQHPASALSSRLTRSGFTLVEFLVVIIIITILIASVLSVLGSTRRNAQRTESRAINRQIATTLA